MFAGRADELLTDLAGHATRARRTDPDRIVANAIGLLFQAYEARAGLIGNTLLALAAHPDGLDPFRTDRRSFTFGAGAHACSGEALATAIAAAGVDRLLRSGVDLDDVARTATYRPSANARVPVFGAA